MIAYTIKTNGEQIEEEYQDKKPTLKEVALIIYKLEELKLKLLSMKFRSKFLVREE